MKWLSKIKQAARFIRASLAGVEAFVEVWERESPKQAQDEKGDEVAKG